MLHQPRISGVYESWQIDICRPCIVLHRVSGCRTHQNRNSPVNHMGIGHHPPGKCWHRLRWWQSWVSGSFHNWHPKTSFEAQQSWPKKWKAKLMSLMSYPVMSHLDQSSRWHPRPAIKQKTCPGRGLLTSSGWIFLAQLCRAFMFLVLMYNGGEYLVSKLPKKT